MKGYILAKKTALKNNKLSKIYDEEPPEHKIFNRKKKPEPIPEPAREDGEWYCEKMACKEEKAMLFDLGDGAYVCGHCYEFYYL